MDVGNGRLEKVVFQPQQITYRCNQLIQKIFPLADRFEPDVAILAPTNKAAEQMNTLILERMGVKKLFINRATLLLMMGLGR